MLILQHFRLSNSSALSHLQQPNPHLGKTTVTQKPRMLITPHVNFLCQDVDCHPTCQRRKKKMHIHVHFHFEFVAEIISISDIEVPWSIL